MIQDYGVYMGWLMDWKYPNFTRQEMACRHCGAEGIRPELMDKLQALRTAYGRPMTVTSGYRCTKHPAEINKAVYGAHTMGLAVDIGVSGKEAYEVAKLAFEHGFTGIGFQQKGDGRFVHLDVVEEKLPRPSIWSY